MNGHVLLVSCDLQLSVNGGCPLVTLGGRGRISLDISLGELNKLGDSLQKQSLILSHLSLIPVAQ